VRVNKNFVLTVVIVEKVSVAVLEDALTAWGIGFAVRAVDDGATTIHQVLAALIDEGSTRILGPSNANAVPMRGLV